MTIKEITLQAIRTIHSNTSDTNSTELKSVIPIYSIKPTPDKNILYLEVEVLYYKNSKKIDFKTETVFNIHINPDNSPPIPTTDLNYYLFAEMTQIAIAHTRALFLQDVRGTIFEGTLLDLEPIMFLREKCKRAVYTVMAD